MDCSTWTGSTNTGYKIPHWISEQNSDHGDSSTKFKKIFESQIGGPSTSDLLLIFFLLDTPRHAWMDHN